MHKPYHILITGYREDYGDWGSGLTPTRQLEYEFETLEEALAFKFPDNVAILNALSDDVEYELYQTDERGYIRDEWHYQWNTWVKK